MYRIRINFTYWLVPFLFLHTYIPTAHSACQVDILSALNFGAYDPDSRLDGVGEVKISCNNRKRIDYVIKLSTGNSGGYMNRALQCTTSSSVLNYNIYINNARNTVWGDGTGGSEVIAKNNRRCRDDRPNQCDHRLFGRIPSGQFRSTAGHYEDKITVTVIYN